MNRQELAFAGMGEMPTNRNEGSAVVRTVRRSNLKESLYTRDIPTTPTHLPFAGGETPKAQNVSLLPEIADVVIYHASTYPNDAYNAGVNTIEYLRSTGLFWLETLGALWAFGQAKRFGRFAKRKWDEFTSPYNNY